VKICSGTTSGSASITRSMSSSSIAPVLAPPPAHDARFSTTLMPPIAIPSIRRASANRDADPMRYAANPVRVDAARGPLSRAHIPAHSASRQIGERPHAAIIPSCCRFMPLCASAALCFKECLMATFARCAINPRRIHRRRATPQPYADASFHDAAKRKHASDKENDMRSEVHICRLPRVDRCYAIFRHQGNTRHFRRRYAARIILDMLICRAIRRHYMVFIPNTAAAHMLYIYA